MTTQTTVITIFLIVAASLVGGAAPLFIRLSHTRLQMLLSFVGGLLIGVGVLHMLPHAALELDSVDTSALALLVGLVGMFFLTRIFHVHHHGSEDEHDQHQATEGTDTISCDHHSGELGWLPLGIGLAFHSLVDGVALAATFHVTRHADQSHWWLGAAPLLAILLHKPFDSLSICSVMIARGVSRRQAMLANLLFATITPLGIILFQLGLAEGTIATRAIVGWTLGISAGAFLCIALGDILPEVRFHSHDRVALSTSLLAGILVAVLIRFAEPSHSHEPAATPQQSQQPAEQDASELVASRWRPAALTSHRLASGERIAEPAADWQTGGSRSWYLPRWRLQFPQLSCPATVRRGASCGTG
jgi:zinc and cadmium transporter